MRMIAIFIGTALLLGATGPAPAQSNDPGINRMQERQENRIEQGAESEKLTPREAARLEGEQKRIAELEERLKSDGTLTARERTRLRHELNQSRRHIERLKHNRRTQ